MEGFHSGGGAESSTMEGGDSVRVYGRWTRTLGSIQMMLGVGDEDVIGVCL